MVVAHHSCLAYTTFAHFGPANYLNSTAPVVDTARWQFFDYAENFNDVFFMSLMFFISGLFVWRSLRRSGVLAFTCGRLLRLGVPFAVGERGRTCWIDPNGGGWNEGVPVGSKPKRLCFGRLAQ